MKNLNFMRASGKADMAKISALLYSDISDYRIAKDTGISRMSIGNFRNQKSDIVKMPVYNAILLTEYAIEKGF